MAEKKLVMKFATAGGGQTSMTLSDAKQDLDEVTVKTAMTAQLLPPQRVQRILLLWRLLMWKRSKRRCLMKAAKLCDEERGTAPLFC